MKSRTIIFHKPYGVLCQFSPEEGTGHKTLRDYIPVAGVYPAGRLDHDSEGLVVLTNDGRLQHRLTEPRYGHPRTYWAQVEGVPGREALEKLERGVVIEGRMTRPARARMLETEPVIGPREPPVRYRKSIPTAWIELRLTEGRNRQVRRMTAAAGHPTLRLVRCAVGGVGLEGLAAGEWRELQTAEINNLLESCL